MVFPYLPFMVKVGTHCRSVFITGVLHHCEYIGIKWYYIRYSPNATLHTLAQLRTDKKTDKKVGVAPFLIMIFHVSRHEMKTRD